MNFNEDFIAVCSWGSNSQYSRIGSDNDLTSAKRQAIIWAIEDQFADAYMRLSAWMS